MRRFLGGLFCFVVFVNIVRSQNIGVGADAIYNFQTESYGAGLRASVFPKRVLSIVPQFAYFFPFNKVTEYYVGLGLEYKALGNEKFNFYAIAHGGYNSWINYESSALKGAQRSNWDLEGGLGISTSKCIRPFLEWRYNAKFREAHARIGFLYIFGCGKAKSTSRCPAFN